MNSQQDESVSAGLGIDYALVEMALHADSAAEELRPNEDPADPEAGLAQAVLSGAWAVAALAAAVRDLAKRLPT